MEANSSWTDREASLDSQVRLLKLILVGAAVVMGLLGWGLVSLATSPPETVLVPMPENAVGEWRVGEATTADLPKAEQVHEPELEWFAQEYVTRLSGLNKYTLERDLKWIFRNSTEELRRKLKADLKESEWLSAIQQMDAVLKIDVDYVRLHRTEPPYSAEVQIVQSAPGTKEPFIANFMIVMMPKPRTRDNPAPVLAAYFRQAKSTVDLSQRSQVAAPLPQAPSEMSAPESVQANSHHSPSTAKTEEAP